MVGVDILGVDLASLSDDDLVAHVAALTDVVAAAPAAREARLDAWEAARDRRPPVPFAKLAQAGKMTTSGVINSLRARREKQHVDGAHKGRRGFVAECDLCRKEAEAKA